MTNGAAPAIISGEGRRRAVAGKCLIISGGEFCHIAPPGPGDFVIACDRGYEYAMRCGIKPDLLVGDFDSYSGPVAPDVPIERLPAEKDDTDTMSAVRLALERGYTDIELLCALGGRLDHSLANIQTAAFAALRGARAVIKDDATEMLVMTGGSVCIDRREGWALSIFSLSDRCEGVNLRGVKYPLRGAVLTNGFPLGVSNEWAAAQAEISLSGGALLVVMAKRPSL